MNKKYELRKELPLKIGKTTLYRIRALKEFSNNSNRARICVGDIGGYVTENRTVLSHKGTCWLGPLGIVTEKEVTIVDDAYVDTILDFGPIKVSGNSKIHGYTTRIPYYYNIVDVYEDNMKNKYVNDHVSYNDNKCKIIHLSPLSLGCKPRCIYIDSDITDEWDYTLDIMLFNSRSIDIEMINHNRMSAYLKEENKMFKKLNYQVCAIYDSYTKNVVNILK